IPNDVAIDSDGNYIVTEEGVCNLVKITPQGERTVIFNYEFVDETGPIGVAIDSDGSYIVTEFHIIDGQTCNLVKITPQGERTVIYEFDPGTTPYWVAIDSDGNYIVTDWSADNLVKITPQGERTVIYEFDPGTGSQGVAIDSDGNYIVAETWGNNLTKITPQGERTVIYEFDSFAGPVGVAIYPDLIPPTVYMTSPTGGSEIKSSTVNVVWTGSDSGSGIDHYEVKFDGGSWINVGTATSHEFTGVTDGSHTIYVKAVDKVGNWKEAMVSFTVSAGIIFGLDLTTIAIIVAVILVVIVVVAYLIMRGRRPPTPIQT
ncbi:MAG: Ig-like domain-containing protein, partial [Candidatus Methylarchaceae archaeon HK01M]|nr:Ig-like domain-containing protein [Candidatus Methylarchaceae archaeon HK01M]